MSGVIIKDVPLATEKEPLDTRIKQYVLFTAKKMGIIEGYSDGTMRPDQNITRAEAVKILLKVQDIDETNESGSGSNFLDVPENAWFTNIIHAAKEREIITGYTDGTFRPEAPISRAEGITIVLRVLRQNPSINGYIVPESME
jgi:hypothetical protein